MITPGAVAVQAGPASYVSKQAFITSAGSFTWTNPRPGLITTITELVLVGGGGGSALGGGGGGRVRYESSISLSSFGAGPAYSGTIGAGGTASSIPNNSGNGGTTTFGTASVNGGNGAENSGFDGGDYIGDVTYQGGVWFDNGKGNSASGGGGAGWGGAGGNGTSTTGGTGGSGIFGTDWGRGGGGGGPTQGSPSYATAGYGMGAPGNSSGTGSNGATGGVRFFWIGPSWLNANTGT